MFSYDEEKSNFQKYLFQVLMPEVFYEDTNSDNPYSRIGTSVTKAIASSLAYCDLTIEVGHWVKAYIKPRTNEGVSFECSPHVKEVFIKMTANNSSAKRVESFYKIRWVTDFCHINKIKTYVYVRK